MRQKPPRFFREARMISGIKIKDFYSQDDLICWSPRKEEEEEEEEAQVRLRHKRAATLYSHARIHFSGEFRVRMEGKREEVSS